MRIFVFYAGLLYGEYTKASFRLLQTSCNSELYNGAYVYSIGEKWDFDTGWFRMDGTPFLLSDVPKELQLSVLLLT